MLSRLPREGIGRMTSMYWDVKLTEPVQLKTGETLNSMGDALETLRSRNRSLESPPVKTLVLSIQMATQSGQDVARQEATRQLARFCQFNRWV